MDPFEATTQFGQMLRSLTPAMPNLTKAAHFALKYMESEDYLFPSLLEIIKDPTIEINTKLNIFQFIEVLLAESYYYSMNPKFNYNYPYVANLKINLPIILLEVLPNSNLANLYNAYTSLVNISKTFKFDCQKWQAEYNKNQDLLTNEDLENISENLPFPPITVEDEQTQEIEQDEINGPLILCWKLLIKKKKQSQYERQILLNYSNIVEDEDVDEQTMFNLKDKNDTSINLSKKQIIVRMEDDRETHKRSKENLWVVERPKEPAYITEDEFLHYYWNKFQKLDDEQNKVLLDSLEDLNKMVGSSYKDRQF